MRSSSNRVSDISTPIINFSLPIDQQQQQQNEEDQSDEAIKCPRCSSTKTKFCYYNNYNKSQPRHFCKTCKRHWTKGGSVRNLHVSSNKNNKKRVKTSKTKRTRNKNPTTTTTATHLETTDLVGFKNETDELVVPLVPETDQDLKFIFPGTSSGSFETDPSSVSVSFEDPSISSSSMMMEMNVSLTDNWNWNEMDTLLSFDFSTPWDDIDINP